MGWKLIRRLNTLAYLEKEKVAKEEAQKLVENLPEEENSFVNEEESLSLQEETVFEEIESKTEEEVAVTQPQQMEIEAVKVVKEKKTAKKTNKKKKAS